MNELQKYFSEGIDGLMDEAVLKVRERVNGAVNWVLFLTFVLSCGHRRLKVLFVPGKMSEEERGMPALSVANFMFMTDVEVIAAFNALDTIACAEFVMAMQTTNGLVWERFNALLKKMADVETAEAECVALERAEIERRATAARAKAQAEEVVRQEHLRVRSDEEMVKYINSDTTWRWKKPEELDALVRDNMVFDTVNRRDIAVADACCVGLCLVTSWSTGKRLGGKADARFCSFAKTREFLEGRAAEAEAIRDMVAAMVAEVKSINELDGLMARSQVDFEGGECRAWPDGYRLGMLKSAANARAREFNLDKVIDLYARRLAGSGGNQPKTPEEMAAAAKERVEREAKRAERRERDRAARAEAKGPSNEIPLYAGAQRRRSNGKGGNK